MGKQKCFTCGEDAFYPDAVGDFMVYCTKCNQVLSLESAMKKEDDFLTELSALCTKYGIKISGENVIFKDVLSEGVAEIVCSRGINRRLVTGTRKLKEVINRMLRKERRDRARIYDY